MQGRITVWGITMYNYAQNNEIRKTAGYRKAALERVLEAKALLTALQTRVA